MKLFKGAKPHCIEFEILEGGKIGGSCKEPPKWIMNKHGWGYCEKHLAKLKLMEAVEGMKRKYKTNGNR